ncbi:glycosyltransferase family 4 protein [Lipingzhangella sp. LS1_29]|uniref:Glycosyltransferase family 4 protein n=1 Tax=Lipingzhangella rawalii TaxID=2055835 RepID=A0ABU2HB43_9ACTN|nr:glycosyltransferase family 4 protein [Lipingzhangella rawalii]MDS1272207.1 glycosyltransferase family 4 protein [Lipingzhangella rawalii]
MVFQETSLGADSERVTKAAAEAGLDSSRSEPVELAPAEEPRLDGVRIAMINWRDPWQSVAGGAEEYAWRISQHLTGRGADVTFLTSREPGQDRRETVRGVAFCRMGGRFTVYLWVFLWLLLRRRRFDLALDCMNGVPFFSRLALPRRIPVVSVVHHVHDLQFCAYFSRPLARIGRFVEGPLASRVYRSCPTVTVSESSRRAMREKLGWKAPISVIHNGSPVAVRGDGDPEDHGSTGVPPGVRVPPAAPPREEMGTPAIVSLGRLVVQKRVARLVDVVAELGEEWPGLRAHIVGRGPQQEPVAERARELNVTDRVVLHGFLPDDQRDAVLAGARLHVTASEFEGWGLTVIEAAALGVPTVAYDVDGLRDSVRDGVTGWLVREGESLTAAVDRALHELADPHRAAEVSQACRAWAASFTWERSGREMTWLLAGLVK